MIWPPRYLARSEDGHFWLHASINGVSRRFLVDTGATLTAISEDTAIAANVPQNAMSRTIRMRTANGEVQAELASIGELRFGNIVARDLDAASAAIILEQFLNPIEAAAPAACAHA